MLYPEIELQSFSRNAEPIYLLTFDIFRDRRCGPWQQPSVTRMEWVWTSHGWQRHPVWVKAMAPQQQQTAQQQSREQASGPGSRRPQKVLRLQQGEQLRCRGGGLHRMGGEGVRTKAQTRSPRVRTADGLARRAPASSPSSSLRPVGTEGTRLWSAQPNL